MKNPGLLFAAAVLAALGGVLYWSNHHKPADTVQAAVDTPPKILSLNDSDVNRVELKKKDGADLVVQKQDGTWQITSPDKLRADDSAVSGMISSLSSLSSDRLVENNADNVSQFGLTSPALEVDVSAKDNTHKLLIGDDTPTGSGSYAKLENDPRVFTIASYTKSNIDKSVNDLRDKRLLTAEPDKVSRVNLNANGQQLEFGRNKDQWQILKPKPLRADSFAVDELVRKLSDAKMDLTSDDQKKAASAFASGKPVATATLTTDSGDQQLQVRKNKDDYYAKSSLVAGVYKVSTDVGEGLNKRLDDFRNKKLFDFGYTDPDKIAIRKDSKPYFLTKGGEDWWSGDGKKLDLSTAESVLDKLRDLQAIKFADSGFGNPILEADVISNNGKRSEKVQIAKSGDRYVAKRENDLTLYVLDSKAVEDLQNAVNSLKPAEAAVSKK
ncbi:MAG TPA: DUF4340 domain-containing protein [Terriglobales bacterium]|nr:DUF4340 domain-containing protein [Terriglobales bacterium]